VTTSRESREEDGRAHCNRRSTKGHRAVAELTDAVKTPTVRCTVGRGDAAGVVMAANKRYESQRRADCSRRKVVGTRRVAKLPSTVASPTVRDTTGGQAAGVVGTREESGEYHRRADCYWRVPTDHSAIAQLAIFIVAPAVGRAGGNGHAADVTSLTERDANLTAVLTAVGTFLFVQARRTPSCPLPL